MFLHQTAEGPKVPYAPYFCWELIINLRSYKSKRLLIKFNGIVSGDYIVIIDLKIATKVTNLLHVSLSRHCLTTRQDFIFICLSNRGIFISAPVTSLARRSMELNLSNCVFVNKSF